MSYLDPDQGKTVTHQGKQYWKGPYGCLVAEELKKIVARDGRNILYRGGEQTEMMVYKWPSQEEWLSKYTEKKEDGTYFYVEKPDETTE